MASDTILSSLSSSFSMTTVFHYGIMCISALESIFIWNSGTVCTFIGSSPAVCLAIGRSGSEQSAVAMMFTVG